MSKKILITGGTGLVGTKLSFLLKSKGYEVVHLSRAKRENADFKTYQWNVKETFIEDGAFESVDIVIHLAGAGVADANWSKSRKKEILESRTLSTKLLHDKIEALEKKPAVFISASGIGYYGIDTGDKLVDEDSSSTGEGFLTEVVKLWEDEVSTMEKLGLRTVKLRTGIVLDENAGALPKMVKPIKYFVGAPLGSGEQYMSWIHVEDLCRLFLASVESAAFKGVYNAVAPSSVTNKEFTEKVAKKLNRFLFLPNVPAWVLKLIFGEMSSIILYGNRVMSKRLTEDNFEMKYKTLDQALNNLI